MKILESEAEIANAQAIFSSTIREQASNTISVTIGFQSGNVDVDVFWLPKHNIWAYFGEPPKEKSPGDRYWNVFGIGKPYGMVSIACEINSPKRGINRQCGGAFARDSSGNVFVIHRGIFTARGRIRFRFTQRNFQWKWENVIDGDRHTEVKLIAAIDSPELPIQLLKFIREVIRFKEVARTRPW